MTTDFRVLPPGSVICGWCDAFEAKALRAEEDAAARYEPALEALRRIAKTPKHAEYCDPEYFPCTRCQAREVLKKHGWMKR